MKSNCKKKGKKNMKFILRETHALPLTPKSIPPAVPWRDNITNK